MLQIYRGDDRRRGTGMTRKGGAGVLVGSNRNAHAVVHHAFWFFYMVVREV
ncbi:MAG: hypothetical protein ACR5K6_05600 [Wolbachia sp.]